MTTLETLREMRQSISEIEDSIKRQYGIDWNRLEDLAQGVNDYSSILLSSLAHERMKAEGQLGLFGAI